MRSGPDAEHGSDRIGRCDVGVFNTIRFVHSAASYVATETLSYRCGIEDQWRTTEQKREAQSFESMSMLSRAQG